MYVDRLMTSPRTASILMAITLVLTACSGTGDTASTTTTSVVASSTSSTSSAAPTDSTTTTAPPPSSTSTSTTTTTAAPEPTALPELLIAAGDGAYLVGADGAVTLLIEGPTAFAIDDLAGGVLFQQERDTRQRRSTVYRVQADGDRAVATLVADVDQSLSLRGITVDGDEAFVYYTRDEGDTPEDSSQTLRRYGLGSRRVTELSQIGGWESGAHPVSVGDGLLLLNWSSEATFGIEVTDLLGSTVSVPGNPSPPEGFFDCNICPFMGEISSDGTTLVYRQVVGFNDFAVIVDVATGEELHLVELNGINRWLVTSFDLDANHLVVNRAHNDELLPALVYDLSQPSLPPIELAIAGEAYLTRSPITIAGPIPAP